MDPDENLREQWEIAHRLTEKPQNTERDLEDAERLAELVLALDTWITNGGALPKSWRK